MNKLTHDQINSLTRATAERYPTLRELGQELSDLYVNANQDKPEKMATMRGLLQRVSPAVIGLVLGEAIEIEIREDLRAGWRCQQCGGRKDKSGNCPACSK